VKLVVAAKAIDPKPVVDVETSDRFHFVEKIGTAALTTDCFVVAFSFGLATRREPIQLDNQWYLEDRKLGQ
jgi:hypothetical protein